ncbi:MAG: TonB-dependent receptor [Candidatus Euphemobacter frigidus]|nr:TonB-dependent receptor [Candidatus Euphemobacter frigidus]MDP8276693.1 TonB-dependent receptor [Candidatus Euphemobacter frigidus]
MKFRKSMLTGAGLIGLLSLATMKKAGAADEQEAALELPAVVVCAGGPPAAAPAGTFAAPVSLLRFNPQVDLQSRNMAEAQADLSIRGGIFSTTGFAVGAITLLDPQTGHYAAEIPIPPGMLTTPRILTGIDSKLFGFNSLVGTVDYQWMLIETGGVARAGLGEHRLNLQHAYAAYLTDPPELLAGLTEKIAFDLDLARSESDGTRPQGDYNFRRIGGRLQFQGGDYQSDLFCGYQSKFFGWPDMYTPKDYYDTDETESLHTTLVILNHRVEYSGQNYLELSGCYRRNRDHYILQRSDPEIYQAFHRTQVWTAGFNGWHAFNFFDLNYSGRLAADTLTSTALTFSPYYSRTIGKLAVLPRKIVELNPELSFSLSCGAAFDDSNRSASSLSPLAGVALLQLLPGRGENRYYCSYASADQLPSYTALGSPPEGLFGGNPDLGLQRSHNLEAGIELLRESWSLHGAVFYRIENDLVDWTYEEGSPNARTASAVDIKTWGAEIILDKKWRDLYLQAGYTCLKKSHDYKTPDVDASFYAINFPRHRFTGTLVWRFLEDFELRSENEYRMQEDNYLRGGRRNACLTYLGLSYLPRILPGLKVTATIDNPFKVSFEEIPGVPCPGRQFTLSVAYFW